MTDFFFKKELIYAACFAQRPSLQVYFISLVISCVKVLLELPRLSLSILELHVEYLYEFCALGAAHSQVFQGGKVWKVEKVGSNKNVFC